MKTRNEKRTEHNGNRRKELTSTAMPTIPSSMPIEWVLCIYQVPLLPSCVELFAHEVNLIIKPVDRSVGDLMQVVYGKELAF